jgi:hypothetical protein
MLRLPSERDSDRRRQDRSDYRRRRGAAGHAGHDQQHITGIRRFGIALRRCRRIWEERRLRIAVGVDIEDHSYRGSHAIDLARVVQQGWRGQPGVSIRVIQEAAPLSGALPGI